VSHPAALARAVVGTLTVAALLAGRATVAQQPATALTRDQQEAFLLEAEIIAARPVGRGVTGVHRLTLRRGDLTHDAAFQAVDEHRTLQRFEGTRRPEIFFRDSYRYNIAASRLAVLVGLGDMVPASVERRWRGARGALTWWVDDVAMDEGERRAKGLQAPDPVDWTRQVNRMRLFTALVHDTDRNLGNNLITRDWRLVMIDFTRAFRTERALLPNVPLARADRGVLDRLAALTEEALDRAMGPHLLAGERHALLARRDAIAVHFRRLVAEKGEAAVLY
jgi:hypothetical protein